MRDQNNTCQLRRWWFNRIIPSHFIEPHSLLLYTYPHVYSRMHKCILIIMLEMNMFRRTSRESEKNRTRNDEFQHHVKRRALLYYILFILSLHLFIRLGYKVLFMYLTIISLKGNYTLFSAYSEDVLKGHDFLRLFPPVFFFLTFKDSRRERKKAISFQNMPAKPFKLKLIK